jgi:hypothetical protein
MPVPPSLDEDVLGRLLDVTPVVEKPVEHRRDAALVRAHDLGEGVHVARRGTGYQLVIALCRRHAADRTMRIVMAVPGIQSDMSVNERLLVGGCEKTREGLSDIADGEARGIRGWRARSHLPRCELCRAVYESLLRTVEGGGAGSPRAASRMRRRLRCRLQAVPALPARPSETTGRSVCRQRVGCEPGAAGEASHPRSSVRRRWSGCGRRRGPRGWRISSPPTL